MLIQEQYPVLEINTKGILNNAKVIVEKCGEKGVNVAGVIKGVNGMEPIAKLFEEAGCSQIASSRIQHLKAYKKKHPHIELLLLRIPMLSELRQVAAVANVSMHSERKVIQALEEVCKRMKKAHKVILMMDLGDLREGFITEQELVDAALWIETELKYIQLAGIGTNLGCYGSIRPTTDNLGRLAALASHIEALIQRPLEFVSGGATTSLPLLLEGKMPAKINHLRIGEGILLNMDLPNYWGIHLPGMSEETFILKGEIIELKEKPSLPIGEVFLDAFGQKPHYEDHGIQKRALLALGKQDFAMEDKLIPMDPNIKIIGSSSDHLIVDLTHAEAVYDIGDAVAFRMYYGPMLHLCTSSTVQMRAVTW